METDWIRSAVADRAQTLGLSARAIALRTDGAVTPKHVAAYLAGRATLGSSRLQHVLDTLDLTIAIRNEPRNRKPRRRD